MKCRGVAQTPTESNGIALEARERVDEGLKEVPIPFRIKGLKPNATIDRILKGNTE